MVGRPHFTLYALLVDRFAVCYCDADKATYLSRCGVGFIHSGQIGYAAGLLRRNDNDDFQLDQCRTRNAVKATLRQYIDFYNKQRPCFAIGYDTPDNFCKRFYRGELEKKDTFSKRILTEEPKFVQKRKDTEK